MNFWETGDSPQENVFHARLRSGCDGDRVAIATQPGCDPKDMYFLNVWGPLSGPAIRNNFCRHGSYLFALKSTSLRQSRQWVKVDIVTTILTFPANRNVPI
jgi:hypothetical protein